MAKGKKNFLCLRGIESITIRLRFYKDVRIIRPGIQIAMVKILRTLMDKVDSVQDHMDNVSREVEILRRNHKEMLKIINILAEMKNAFGGLIE